MGVGVSRVEIKAQKKREKSARLFVPVINYSRFAGEGFKYMAGARGAKIKRNKKEGEMNLVSVDNPDIQSRIFTLRDQQVMLDRDLAQLYGVETKALNQAVKRNPTRFPTRFRFQLNRKEFEELVTFCDRFRSLKHSAASPYAFTEQGVAMLSAVLKSETAVAVSLGIMDAFVRMRRFLQVNGDVFKEIERMKARQLKADGRIDELFALMDRRTSENVQGVFFQGQIFDAYAKVESFIRQAKKSLVLIDNYIDLPVLERLAAKKKSVRVTVWTSPRTKLTKEDISRFNAQYPNLTVRFTTEAHDRFLIVDDSILYHVGASLKDLGKKCFAFDILDPRFIPVILSNL